MKKDAKTNKFEFLTVDTYKEIETNAVCINQLLAEVIERFDIEFKQYIELHRGRKVKKIFQHLNYANQQITEKDFLASNGYASIKRMVKDFKEEIILRYKSPENYGCLHITFAEIDDLFSLLDEHISEIPADIRHSVNHYLTQLLFVKVKKLEKYSEEIDAYFECYGKPPCTFHAKEFSFVFTNEDGSETPVEDYFHQDEFFES